MKSSDFLFAMPSFKNGMARILDFGSTLNIYNTSDSSEEADCNALYSDWYVVGQDLYGAMKEYDGTIEKETGSNRKLCEV